MGLDAFKKFTVTAGGTPQPLIGSYITATTAVPGADFQGETLTNLPVNDSSMFEPGDMVLVQTVTNTVIERVRVQSVPDTTHIKVRGLVNTRTGGAFGTGDFVSLAVVVNWFYVQCIPGNAGTLYLGTAGLVKATLANVIAQLLPFGAAVQPIDFSDARTWGPNASDISDIWVDGNTGDGYLPSVGIV